MTRIVEDQIGQKVEIPTFPKRIVSLVPSQTELLSYFELENEVVGITRFCIHPNHWFRSKTRIGGTKSLHIEKIKSLKPDLILANKEENNKVEIETLKKDFPVWTSNVKTVSDAFEMIKVIGEIVNQPIKANQLIIQLKSDFGKLNFHKKKSAAYLIWYNPIMISGGDTFINSMMDLAGFDNVFKDRNRYPTLKMADLIEHKPEIILLSSEPYPFKEKHIREFQEAIPKSVVKLVDGEIFSWYGSRMLHAGTYFKKLYPY